jgi:hypothetical protein
MSGAFRVTTDSGDIKAGTIVYSPMGWDYGLASDDTRATGEPHVSISLQASGAYPTKTIPSAYLIPITAAHAAACESQVSDRATIGAAATTAQETRHAAIWLQEDAEYLYGCARRYRDAADNWMAARVQENAAHSAALARAEVEAITAAGAA